MTPHYGAGAETPFHDGSRTPYSQGTHTPFHGGQTPAHGSVTPHHRSPPGPNDNRPFEPAYAHSSGTSTSPTGSSPRSHLSHSPSSTSGSPQGSLANPTTPSIPEEIPGHYQEYHQGTPQGSYDNERTSMFTPTTPTTPAGLQTYDPSDVSDSNEDGANWDMGYASTDSPPRDGSAHNMSSDIQSESASEMMQAEQLKDPFYFVKTGAFLRHNEQMCQVTEVNGDKVTIKIGENTETVEKEVLQHVAPPESSRVQVVLGKLNGEQGELIGIDGDDAIVKMDVTYEIQILQHNSLVQIESG